MQVMHEAGGSGSPSRRPEGSTASAWGRSRAASARQTRLHSLRRGADPEALAALTRRHTHLPRRQCVGCNSNDGQGGFKGALLEGSLTVECNLCQHDQG